MNAPLQAFCERCLSLQGVVASAVRAPDGRVHQRSAKPWFTPTQIQQVMTRLAVAAESLKHQVPDAKRLLWTFEHVQIHLASRPDGAHLAVFLENRGDTGLQPLQRLFADFVTL